MTSISVARILQLRIAIAWQEAVEVTAAAGRLSAADGTPITLDHCVICSDGTVRLSRGTTGSREPALSPMQLLQAMLEGQTAPPELRALAENREDALAAFPTEQGGGSLGRPDLSWFLRPNPEVGIARLAARALAADAEAGITSEISRLRAAVAEAPSPAASTPAAGARWKRLARRVGLATVATLLVAVAGVNVVPLLSQLTSAWPARDQAVSESELLPSSDKKTFDPVALRAAAASRQPAGAPSTAAPGYSASRGRAFAGGGTHAVPATAGLEPSAVTALESMAPPAIAATPLTDVEATGTEDHLYSSIDQEVTPPELVHPKLPTEQRVDSEQSASTIEVTVDAAGHVVQVRLQSGNDASLHDRMLVAAAKAWQFRPAIRDGRPVPYVLRVPVTR